MEDKHLMTLVQQKKLKEQVNKIYKKVMLDRENIIRAFIAETGYKPSEIEQVEIREETKITWYLRKKKTEIKNYELDIKNLMCIIHRDGGHYIADHGYDKALKDAHKIILEWRPE